MNREEMEEYLNAVDVNKNGVSDKKEIKSYFKSAWNWIKSNKALVIVSILLLSCMTWIVQVENNPEVKKLIVKEARDNTQLKLKDSVVCYDLSKMDVTKHVESTSIKSGKEIFGVWYRTETPKAAVTNSVYLTIFENIDAIDKNKNEFNKYIELESKKAATLSK